MANTAQRLQELARREPLLQQAEAARRVGVSREYVRQLTNKLDLPFAKGNGQLRVLRLYHAGLHQTSIADIVGVSRGRVTNILHKNGLPLRTLPKPCEWCGTTYESFASDHRWCSRSCGNNHRAHLWQIKIRGNGVCLFCGTQRAFSFKYPCNNSRQRHRFTQPRRDGKAA